MATIKPYPLQWPSGWKRTKSADRKTGKFESGMGKITVAGATKRILQQLELMGVSDDDLVISTNIELRLDGMPRGDKAVIEPGVACYWMDGDQHRCMAIDIYTKVEQNIAAVAETIKAMRSIERHGGAAILDRAFSGFTALPERTDSTPDWRDVLGFKAGTKVTVEDVGLNYRALSKKHHPDNGGDKGAFATITRARDMALAELQ